MDGIFNLFGDSTRVATTPIAFGSVGSNANSTLRLKNVGAPGATPGKIFTQKSKGLKIRSTSDLNICSPAPQSFDVKRSGGQAGKFLLKPIDIFEKSTSLNKQKSPTKQKSPNKLKSPKKQFKNSNIPPIILSPNVKEQTTEKSEEFVFKKPKTPRRSKKLDMDYPEPEVLAPIGDIDIELFDLRNKDFLKSFKNKYFLVDEFEELSSDIERVPVVEDEIRVYENVPEDMEIALPEIKPFSGYEDTPN